MRKLGYFTEWSIYREHPQSLSELVIDGGYTDIIYAFAIFDKTGQLTFGDPYAANDKHILQDIRTLKASGELSRIGVSIGGWNNRADFEKLESGQIVESIAKFVIQHDFDLVDIDWEFDSPEAARGYQRKFKNLITGLKSLLPCHVEFMVSFQCNIGTVEALRLSEINSCVSLFNVMGYDLSGAWSPVAEHYSSLAIVSKVFDYLSRHVPMNKICIGVSGFGGRFTGCQGIGCEFRSFDLITSKEIKSREIIWYENHQCSIYLGNDETVLSIESKESLASKEEFVKCKGFAGICVWDIEAFSHIQ